MQNLIHDRRLMQSKAAIQMLEESQRYSKEPRRSLIRSDVWTPCNLLSPAPISSKGNSQRDTVQTPLLIYETDEAALALPQITIELDQRSLTKQSPSVSQLRPNQRVPWNRTNSDHTFLSADGARVSYVTAHQTEAELNESSKHKGIISLE